MFLSNGSNANEKDEQPSNTMLTVSQHEHLTCLAPRGYESRRWQEPQTIWAQPVHTACQSERSS